MSNEYLDWKAEVDAYEKAVHEDFLAQRNEFPPSTGENIDEEFIAYLLSRMRNEGLPEKEPR